MMRLSASMASGNVANQIALLVRKILDQSACSDIVLLSELEVALILYHVYQKWFVQDVENIQQCYNLFVLILYQEVLRVDVTSRSQQEEKLWYEILLIMKTKFRKQKKTGFVLSSRALLQGSREQTRPQTPIGGVGGWSSPSLQPSEKYGSSTLSSC
jgi:hypothetical protein